MWLALRRSQAARNSLQLLFDRSCNIQLQVLQSLRQGDLPTEFRRHYLERSRLIGSEIENQVLRQLPPNTWVKLWQCGT